MVKQRNQLIDVLKGFSIISVIMGHSIQRGLGLGFEENIIYKVIFSYNMPLFMALSGYTLYLSSKKFDFNFLKGRFKRLIIPTIIFTYIFYFIGDFWFVGLHPFKEISHNFLVFTKNFIIHPDDIVWFLYIVFLCNLIFWFGKNFINKYFNVYITLVTLLVFVSPIGAFGIERLKLYLPIFIGGYWIAQYRVYFFKYLKYALIPSLIFWILFARYWTYDSPYYYQYLIAFASCTVIYYIFRNIKNKTINKVLIFFGQKSLEYYVCHILVLGIGIGTGILRITTIFISASVISTILIIIIKKFKFTNAFFFGGY